MKVKIISATLLWTLSLCAHLEQLDFEHAMGKDHAVYGHYFKTAAEHTQATQLLHQFENLYLQTFLHRYTDNQLHIPKIIHQIWLGSPLPEHYYDYCQSWQEMHPDWHYILWTDAKIQEFKLENQAAYDRAINYAERSDIARYEILYRMGGVYVDTDFQCLKPLDPFHYSFDFYAGLELPAMALFLQPVIIPNALIGSKPGHPIMRACIDAIQTNQEPSDDIVVKTGPVMLTKMVLENINHDNNNDVIMPASYFYPIDKNTKDPNQIQQLFGPQTYAVHHWHGSWILKEQAFVPGIKIRSSVQGNKITFKIIDERNKQ